MRIDLPENNSKVTHIEINRNNDVIIHYSDGRAHDCSGYKKVITDHVISPFTVNGVTIYSGRKLEDDYIIKIEIPNKSEEPKSYVELSESGNISIVGSDISHIVTAPHPSPFGPPHMSMDPFPFPPHKAGVENISIAANDMAMTVANFHPSPEIMNHCECDRCRKEAGEIFRDRFYVCPVCGNKRCPKNEDHRFKCTGSNELNQVGVLENE